MERNALEAVHIFKEIGIFTDLRFERERWRVNPLVQLFIFGRFRATKTTSQRFKLEDIATFSSGKFCGKRAWFVKRELKQRKGAGIMTKIADKKEKQLLDYYYNSFITNTFDEKDVHSFFILSRDYAKDDRFVCSYGKDNWIIEICDFIAHRERDRGLVYETMEAVKNVDPLNQHGKIAGSKGIESCEFVKMFNSFVEIIGYNPLTTKTVLDIFLCVYSIMQFIVIKSNNQHLGELIILITPSHIALVTAGTHMRDGKNRLHSNVSILENTYMRNEVDERKPAYFCENPIVVRRDNGELIIEYDGVII